VSPRDVAVLGCTGLVGQSFVRRLAHHPQFRIKVLAASPRSAGKKWKDCVSGSTLLPERIRNMEILPLEKVDLPGRRIGIAFSALPSGIAKPREACLRDRGVVVFSNAGSHRMDPDVPILVPEVNAEHLELARLQIQCGKGAIITNANCVTAGLVLTLAPLVPLGLKSVHLFTCQALSGAGRRGPSAHDMNGNILPHIEGEEEKIIHETRRILGTLKNGSISPFDIDITTSCCRVPVNNGHMLHVVAGFNQPVSPETARNALTGFRGRPQDLNLPSAPIVPVILRPEKDRPQPRLDVDAGGTGARLGMAVSVGRLRGESGRVQFSALVHNLERGAAGNSVLNAELAMNELLLSAPRGGEPCES